jgi:peptidoglycan/LPS O-acetylase OafA/YrhL
LTDSKNIKQTLVWPDQVRAIATVSVILLHVAAPLLYQYRKIEISDWWIANSIDSAMRFCVPVFMMLTGALLLSKNEPTTLFYKKRFSRLVYPFVLWTTLYLWYNFNPKVTKDFNLIYVWEQLKNGTSLSLVVCIYDCFLLRIDTLFKKMDSSFIKPKNYFDPHHMVCTTHD